MRLVVLMLIAVVAMATAQAAPKLPSFFSDGMVLQRDLPLAIWGWAQPAEKIHVEIAGKSADAVTGPDGRWSATLPALAAGGPFTLTVRGDETLTLNDVYAGEVWLCSGQSNMAFTLNHSLKAADEIAKADLPLLHVFTVREQFSLTPLDNVKGRWTACTPASAGGISAVSYYFGKDLVRALNVPVGLVVSSISGTPAEAWTTRDALAGDPAYASQLDPWKDVTPSQFVEIGKAYTAFQHERDVVHPAAVKEAKEKGLPEPPAPVSPKLRLHDCPGAVYDGMIAPLVPLSLRGVLWLQGENNSGRPAQYAKLLQTMIYLWRANWNRPDLAFDIVEIANFEAVTPQPVESGWATLRESQRKALVLPNTGLAVTIDLGEANNIHYLNKAPAGQRAARWALASVYKQPGVVASGPMETSVSAEGDTLVVHFANVAEGLSARGGGPLKEFAVGNGDGKFVWADATIAGHTVRVHADGVVKPSVVRYAWADNPEGANLVNSEDLPAAPFEASVTR